MTEAPRGAGVAIQLNLANPEDYSSHSVRRSTATTAAENDITPDQLCSLMGWKTHKMTRVYINNTVKMKTKTAHQIFGVNPTSTDTSQIFPPKPSTSGLSGLASSMAQDER